MSAETDTGGVQVNVVPKTGGNTFAGNVAVTGANDTFQVVEPDRRAARARADEHRRRSSRSTTSAAALAVRSSRTSCGSTRRIGGGASQEYAPGSFYNKTQGTPVYTPDPDRRGYTDYYAAGHTRAPDVAGDGEAQDHVLRQPAAQLQLPSLRRQRDSVRRKPRWTTRTSGSTSRRRPGAIRPRTGSCSRPGRRSCAT